MKPLLYCSAIYKCFTNSQISRNAITPFRILSAHWLDDHDRPTITKQSTREVTACAVLESVASNTCAPDLATVQTPAVVYNLGISVPLVDPDCHYFDRESFHSRRCGGGGCLCFGVVGKRGAAELTSP